jgi:hypothetical protein
MEQHECTKEQHFLWIGNGNDNCPTCHRHFTIEDKEESFRNLMDEVGNTRRDGIDKVDRIKPQQSHEKELMRLRYESKNQGEKTSGDTLSNISEATIVEIKIDIDRLAFQIKLIKKLVVAIWRKQKGILKHDTKRRS